MRRWAGALAGLAGALAQRRAALPQPSVQRQAARPTCALAGVWGVQGGGEGAIPLRKAARPQLRPEPIPLLANHCVKLAGRGGRLTCNRGWGRPGGTPAWSATHACFTRRQHAVRGSASRQLRWRPPGPTPHRCPAGLCRASPTAPGPPKGPGSRRQTHPPSQPRLRRGRVGGVE